MFSVNNNKQPPEVFYKTAVLKNFLNIPRKIPVSESLFNQVAGLNIRDYIKKRFQHMCFSVTIAKFLNMLILKRICERLLLNNVKRNFSSIKTVKYGLCQAKLFIHKDCEIRVKCFSIFTGKHLYQKALFDKYSWSRQLNPIFIQKKHCYKKSGSGIYHKSNYAIFTSPRFLYFSTVLSDDELYIDLSFEKITKSSK